MNWIFNLADRVGINSREVRRFVKFAVVGTGSTLIDVAIFAGLVEYFGVSALPANILSYSVGIAFNFLLNRAWTYAEARNESCIHQFARFFLVNMTGLCLNSALLVLAENALSRWLTDAHLPAKIVATGIVLFWNFFMNRYWTFGHPERNRGTRPAAANGH